MAVSELTAINVATNYPDDILVTAGQDFETNLWSGYIYLLRDEKIHTLLLSSDPIFKTQEEAKDEMVKVCEKLCLWHENSN